MAVVADVLVVIIQGMLLAGPVVVLVNKDKPFGFRPIRCTTIFGIVSVMIIFVSGLPGSGKSTVGSLVAEKLGWPFVEADEYLSEETKEQIKTGELLSQKQLDDWIVEKLIPNIVRQEKEGPLVVAGMLAEERFVEQLSQKSDEVLYINLNVPYEVLEKRVGGRDHFAKKEMLDKCWESKEKFVLPGPSIDATKSLYTIVEEILSKARI